jgi:hypothetical protein
MKGTLETITPGGIVRGNTITFDSELEVNKSSEADIGNDHRSEGWYIEVKLIAPSDYEAGARYKSQPPLYDPTDSANS